MEVATVDACDEEEQSMGWLTCFEELFGEFDRVMVLGEETKLVGFDLKGNQVVAKCQKGKKTANVSLTSVEFPKLNKTQTLWLNAWKAWAGE